LKESLVDQRPIMNLTFNFGQKRVKNQNFTNKSWVISQILFKGKKLERFDQFLTQKNDFENHNFEIFEVIFIIGHRSARHF